MTTEQEAELVKLLAEATPRPWVCQIRKDGDVEICLDDGTKFPLPFATFFASSDPDEQSWPGAASAALCARAVNLLPALLEERRALKEALRWVTPFAESSILLVEGEADEDELQDAKDGVAAANAALALAARPVGE